MRVRPPALALAVVALTAAAATLLPAPAVTAADDPGTPRSVDVDIRSDGTTGYAVRWADPAGGAPTSYEVLVDGTVRRTVAGTVRSAVLGAGDGVVLGGTHDVRVRAVDGGARGDAVGQSLVLTYGPRTPRLPQNPTNPLAGLEWGTYLGRAEEAYEPWRTATGATRAALGQIALQPKAKWFGTWITDADAERKVREYIRDSAHGDRDVLSQMTLYRLRPWGETAHRRLPTAAERASYTSYVTSVARAIGDRPMAVVLQPDGAWMQGAPRGRGSLSRMLGWTVRTLEALPRTAVYLEIGSADWLRNDPKRALRLLMGSGIKHARGFALAVTHMDTTEQSVRFGARVVDALAARGVPGKHLVVDTADNGRGFNGVEYRKVYPKRAFDTADMCRTATQQLCVALGIPPTTDVADPRWGLPADVRAMAAEDVDAYLWINRPWLHHQTYPYVKADALALASQNPWD
ncbi:glycoside hydrolase family 6 protein [Nocardioides litoris]|uniref:glycoside hydrolase family 6 protein n=1 Tax=Nocardioides litoris TaxID=1926648 RepID=UPI00111CFD22|nr:glycoside hydrolase family 6 protein [Nocardioides litoris]